MLIKKTILYYNINTPSLVKMFYLALLHFSRYNIKTLEVPHVFYLLNEPRKF